jgi:hypothetical protein
MNLKTTLLLFLGLSLNTFARKLDVSKPPKSILDLVDYEEPLSINGY